MAWRRCIDLAPNHYKYRLNFDFKNTFIEKNLPMQCCQTNVVGCTFFDTLNIRFEQLTTFFINVARNLKMYDIYLKMYDINLKMYDIYLKMYDINPLMYRRNLNAYGRNLKMY